MAFNIRKITGRQEGQHDADVLDTSKEEKLSGLDIQTADYRILSEHISEDRKLNDLFALFESIVSHNYLTKLSSCPVLAPLPEVLCNMGWYKITEIVLDGDVFFPDQLSMLYTALHAVAQTVALLVEKKGPDNVEIFIGARDFTGNDFEAAKLLNNSIQGFIPGVKTSYERDKLLFENENSRYYVASYSGVASFKDEKKDTFIQGLEKFIDATPAIPSFTAVFIAESIGVEQANSIIDAYSDIEDAISPLMESQETVSENQTEGVSKTITDTIGETLTESLSKTVTRSEGTNTSFTESEATTHSDTVNKSSNILRSTWSKIFGGKTGVSSNTGHTTQSSKQTGQHTDMAEADGKTSSTAHQKSKATAEGTNYSSTKGSSMQIARTNKKAKRYVDILDRQIERIQKGMSFGLWSVGTYFVSQDSSTSKKLANIYQGCITGEDSDIETSAVNVWGSKESKVLISYLRELRNPRFLVGNINVSSGTLATSKDLSLHMSFPQKSIPGVEVRESVSFGRNVNKKVIRRNEESENLHISVGNLTHLGNVSQQSVPLDVEEISQHVFVTGSTGSGKSNTTYLLVTELLKMGKKVLVIEPTKGDYKKVFGGRGDITVYGTRPNEGKILRINPFAFPSGVRVEEHVERLVEIFGVCWPMYAAMPAVLKDSIFAAYEACGWDIVNSICRYGTLYPTVADVIDQLKRIIISSEYSSDTKGDYIGALQTRLQSLTNGIYKFILTSDGIPFSDLYDNNVIIDLHHVGSSETRALLMGLVVLGLKEWRSSEGEDKMDERLKYVAVLEEAHCILPRVSKQQSQESSNVVGKSVEMIVSSIAEMRTYGQGFVIVDQSPSAVDEAAIGLTNTKIVMNLPAGDDREIAGKSIGLTEELQIAELAKLSTGEAVVFQRGWCAPVMTTIHKVPTEEFNPFTPAMDKILIQDLEANRASELFVSCFILKERKLTNTERKTLQEEIVSSKGLTSNKVRLLDFINSNEMNDVDLSDAVIEYLGLKRFITKLFNNTSSGSYSIIRCLRRYMGEYCEVIDTEAQNSLLSMTFAWASIQNKKWETICVQSMPINNSKHYGFWI